MAKILYLCDATTTHAPGLVACLMLAVSVLVFVGAGLSLTDDF